jgi:cyclopropane-fatty-acyl-phospholipid synthase
LRHWLARYDEQGRKVVAQFGERFFRTWRFYLSGSIAAFESGSLQLFQMVFAPGLSNRVPATREHLYQAASESPAPTG